MSPQRLSLVALLAGTACAGVAATPPVAGTGAPVQAAASAPARLRVQILETLPHDATAYTQGLVLDGDVLYESTGLVGRSSLRRVDLKTGRVLQKVDQPDPIFSEGLAVIGPHLVQLTWQNGIVYQYDKQSLKRTRDWGYSGEGWGACYDGQSLVTSDGSSRLVYRDPSTLAIRRNVAVTLGGRPLDQLNELECVDGHVWSNVWQTDTIVRIDPRTGRVLAVVEAGNLLTAGERAHTDVLNGIAYDAKAKNFLITGKLWPKLFRVLFVP
jgi:glutaminyl-peptide cyclotransferase